MLVSGIIIHGSANVHEMYKLSAADLEIFHLSPSFITAIFVLPLFTIPADTAIDITGGAGYRTWVFRVETTGATVISLIYSIPWHSGRPTNWDSNDILHFIICCHFIFLMECIECFEWWEIGTQGGENKYKIM